MAPFNSSVSSYTSSSDDDDLGNDLSDKVTSSPNEPIINRSQQNKKFLYHNLFTKPWACFGNDEFWKTVYVSMANLLREKLGWDEKTPELYQR